MRRAATPLGFTSRHRHGSFSVCERSVQAIFRAFFGYFFLVLIVRVVGRRPGRQLTPFEFVLVFFIGGLILARLRDGTPLILMETDAMGRRVWRTETMARMRIQDTDVMFSGRDHGLKTLQDIECAILERNGDISVMPSSRSASRGGGDRRCR